MDGIQDGNPHVKQQEELKIRMAHLTTPAVGSEPVLLPDGHYTNSFNFIDKDNFKKNVQNAIELEKNNEKL